MTDFENSEEAKYFKKLLDDAFDYEESLKRQNLKHEDVVKLRGAIQKSEIVPKFISDKTLLLFLNAYKNDVEKSAEKLEAYYKLKQTTPEFFSNRDLQSQEIQSSFDHQDYAGLPVTPDNCSLIFHRLSSFEPRHYVFDEAVKTFIITSEANVYRDGPRDGTIFLFDLTGVTFWHIFRPSVSSVRKGIRFLEDGCPLNIKAIHILNTVPFFDLIIGLIRPFVMTSLLSKIHFHSSSMDYEKFYKECIPKSHLPSDYGGDLESVEVLNKKHREGIMKLRDYFMIEEQQQHGAFEKYVGLYDPACEHKH